MSTIRNELSVVILAVLFVVFLKVFPIFLTESSFLIVLISNCAPFLLFFASEAPDQAPRELKDGMGPRPAGPPGTDGRTKIALKNLIFRTIRNELSVVFAANLTRIYRTSWHVSTRAMPLQTDTKPVNL